MTQYDAAELLMGLDKKLETFRRHFEELEEVSSKDEDELERFLRDYDSLDDILNQADELQTKLQYIVKFQDEHTKVKEKELKINLEQENEKLRIESQEKIELEKINVEKLKIEAAGGVVKNEATVTEMAGPHFFIRNGV